jgi:hypothetical protein
MYKIMKNQIKPIIVNSATKLIEEIMEDKKWSLVDSIESIESAIPFYDSYDVIAQLINYGLLWHAFLFFLKRRFSKKGKIYLKDWKIIISRLAVG